MSKKQKVITSPLEGLDLTDIPASERAALIKQGVVPGGGIGSVSPGHLGRVRRDTNSAQYGSLIFDENDRITASPEQWQDLAADNQSWNSQMGRAIPRLAGSTLLKLGQGVGMLGSAIYMGLNPNEEFSLESITDNALVNSLFKAEEAMKESPAFKIYKPSDWDDRSIWQQLGSTAWWADEFTDGAAFAAQAYLSGGAIGSLRLGSSLLGAGRAAQANALASMGAKAAGGVARAGAMGAPTNAMRAFLQRAGQMLPNKAQVGLGIDFMSQVGIMTATEALFEARDIGHSVQQRLLEDAGFDVQGMSPEEQLELLNSLPADLREDLKQKKGQAMQNTFVANMAAISFSNIIEVSALNKLMGKSLRKLTGNSPSASRGIDLGTSIFDDASVVQRKGIQRYIGRGSRPRAIASGLGTQALSEGFYEENIQNSISNISEQFEGDFGLEYLSDVFSDMINNTFSGDQDAWKSIVTGALLGGLMGVGSSVRQYNADANTRQELVDRINKSKANLVDVRNAVMKDADGKVMLDENQQPIPDRDALMQLAANQQKMLDIADLHDMYKEAGNSDIASVLWNDALTELSLSYLEAGFGEDLLNKVKGYKNFQEEAAIENGLEETSEVNEQGRTVSISEKVQDMINLVENVKQDYEAVTQLIPNTEDNNLRINRAVKTISRIRTLKERQAEATQRFDNLKASFTNPITDINLKIDRLNELKSEINKLEKSFPEAANNLKKKAQLLEKEIEQSKSINRNQIQEQGVTVPPGNVKIVEGDNSPARVRLDSLNRRIAQFDSAIEDQLERYNKYVVNPTGMQEEIVKAIKENAKKNQSLEDLANPIANAQAGDFAEVVDKKGNVRIIPVQQAPDGSLMFGGIVAKKAEDLSGAYSSIRLLSPEERADYIERESLEFRKNQVRNRIKQINESVKTLLEKQEKQVEALIKAEDNLASLRVQKATGKTRMSEKTLNKRLTETENLINTLQQEIDLIDETLAERQETINGLEIAINNGFVETDLDTLNKELDLLKEEYVQVELERIESVKFLDKLKDYYNFLKDYWRKFFPNKIRVFQDYEDAQAVEGSEEFVRMQARRNQGIREQWNDPSNLATQEEAFVVSEVESALKLGQEYSDFKQDMNTTKAEISEREEMVKALEERSQQLSKKLEFREKEIRQYEKFLQELENPGEINPIAGQEEGGQNLVTLNGSYVPKPIDKDDKFRPRKSIVNGLFTTTGNSTVNTPEMNRWFKFTETAELGPNSQLILLPVTIHHPVFGIGKPHDLFSSEPEAFRTIDNIKVVPIRNVDALATEYGGVNPYLVDGQIVSTSLVEITPNKTTFNDFLFRDGTSMFHNKEGLTNDKISEIIKDYKKLTDKIKKDAQEGKHSNYLYAKNKSWGRINSDGILRSAPQAFGYIPQLEVSTKKDVQHMAVSYDVEIGMGYVWHKGRPIPANARKINNAEAEASLKLLKDIAKDSTRAQKNNPLINRLRSVVFIGKSANPEYSTFFTRGNKDFIFGDTRISLEDLIEGRYDAEIINHLTKLNHQINLRQLKDESPYTSLTGEVYPNYNDYLLNPQSNGRNEVSIPVTFDIIANSNETTVRQIDGVYLSFGNTPKKTFKKKDAQQKVIPAQKESENKRVSSYSSVSGVLAEANAVKKQEPSEEELAELAEFNQKEDKARLDTITEESQIIRLDNGIPYVIDRKNKVIFDAETGALVESKSLREEIVARERELNLDQTTENQNESYASFEEAESSTEEAESSSNLEAELQDFLKAEIDSPFDEFTDVPQPNNPQGESIVEESSQDFLENEDFGFRSLTPEELTKAKQEEISNKVAESKKEFNNNAQDLKDNDDAPFLLKSKVSNYNQADVNQELKELERLVGSKALAGVVSGLIRNKAFGQTLEDGRILLSELMTEGTVYHEAFHRVFEGIVSPKIVRQIIQEWKTNNPQAELSDYQIIEELAEEFRDYMLTNSRPDGLLGRTLNWIKNLLNSLLGIPVSTRDRLFYKIKQGDFKDAKVTRSIRPEVYSEVGGTFLRNNYGTVVEREVMEGLSYSFLESLVSNNFNVDDILNFNSGALSAEDSTRFRNIYLNSLQAVIQEINKHKGNSTNPKTDELILDLFTQFKQGTRSRLFLDFNNYLQRYNITLNEEQQNAPLAEDEKSKDTLGIISSVEFNVKSGVPNAVKLVIASLPSLNSNGIPNRNSLGLPKLSNYKKNLAVLHNHLAGLETVKEMRDKIVELASTFPEYFKLLQRLDIPVTGDNMINDSTPVETVRLQNQFKQQFDKAHKVYFLQMYDENGNSYFIDANTERAVDIQKQKWAANFRLLPKENLQLVNGRYVYSPEFFEKFKGTLRANSEVLSFYKALGINFSKPEALTDAQFNTLRTNAKNFQTVIERGDVESLFVPDLNISGWLNEVIGVELAHSVDFSDNQHINAEGKTVHGITLNTYLDLVIRKINKAVPDFLKWDEETKTGNAFTRNSVFLKGKFKLKLDILGGAKSLGQETDTSGLGTDKLSRSEAAIQQFASVMSGIFPFIRQGDRKIEYAITLLNPNGGRANVESLNVNTIQDITEVLKGYLADELLTSWQLNKEIATGGDGYGANIPTYREAAQDLRVFKGIFNKKEEDAYKAIINNKNLTQKQAIERIQAFLNKRTQQAVEEALQRFITSKVESNLNEFVNNGVLTLTAGNNYVNNGLPIETLEEQTTFTKEEILPIIERFTYLYQIGNIEQEKLFTGDFAFYKKKGNVHDFFKRTSGLGGTGKTLRNDSEFNDWMEKNMSRPDRTINGKIDTWVFDDVVVKSSLYQEYIDTLVKEFNFSTTEATKLLSSYNGYDEADAQGFVTLPEYREILFRAGDWTTSHELVYQKIQNNETLTPEDAFTFPPLKPQYFGPQEYEGLYVPTFYKLSLMPLIPSMFPERSPLAQLNQDMIRNGVGIATFTSGNKVGKLDGQVFYNENGRYNQEEKQRQILDYDFMKVQLDMSPEKHDKVTFGTQFRKLVLSNLTGKSLYKKIKGEDYITRFNELIKQQIELEKKSLFKRILKESTNNQISKVKLSEVLREEAYRRGAPNNVIDDIEMVLSKDRNAEIMLTRGNMESILMSLVNNTLVHNKVFGDMMVQAASTGFEGRNRTKLQKDVKNEPWASDLSNLQFYKYDSNGTSAMEIYVPHRFKELYGKDINIEDIDPRLLELIGFRIPTQGLNSIEVIKIKGFLPQEAGNTVIVPSEIVAKAGSDFDIDKLTLFMPNYKVNYKKALKSEALKRFPELATNTSFSSLVGNKRSYRFIDNISTYEELEHMEGVLDSNEQRLLELYKQFRKESVDDFIESIEYVDFNPEDKRGVQNEIIRLSREIVLAPENFKDLITPVSSDLIRAEATYLESKKPSLIEEKDRGNYADFDYIMSVREDFLTGKDGVGIAASNLTHHVLSQQAGLKINTDKTWINLEHNTTITSSSGNLISVNTYEGTIDSLKENQVFVFGSNPLGINGNPSKGTGGAALVANRNKWVEQREKLDNRLSKSGKAWGIVTVSSPGAKRSISPSKLKENISKLYRHASNNPNKEFLVAYTTGRNLNGYSTEEMASFFREAGDIPSNVIFNSGFANVITQTRPSLEIDLSQVHSVDNRDNPNAPTILDTISAFLNGFVDIAKDPFLRVINASTDTAGTYLYLIRAGVPLRQAVLFMNQPIVLDYLKNRKLGQSLARKAKGENKSRNKIIEETLNDYSSSETFDLTNTIDREEYLKLMSNSNLAAAIEGKLDNITFNKMQNQVLMDFLEYSEASGKLLELHQATNSDTKGTGPSMFSASDLIERFENIKNEGYFENVDRFESNSILGTFNNSVKTAVDVYKPVFPIFQGTQFKEVLNTVVNTIRLNKFISDKNVQKVVTTLENDFIGYLFQHSLANSGIKRGDIIKTLFSGEQSLPKRIAKIKNDSSNTLSKNLLIEELYPILSSTYSTLETKKDFDNLKFFSRRIIKEHADDLTNAWEELHSLQPTLANQLFTFAVLQSGFNNSSIEFLKYAPARVYSDMLHLAINRDASSQQFDMSDFIIKFFQNNMMNSDLVPYVRESRWIFNYETGRYFKKSNIKDNKISGKTGHIGYPFIRTSVLKNPQNKTDRKQLLFQDTGLKSEKGFPIFTYTGTRGNGMFFKEWTGAESIIADNRGPKNPITVNNIHLNPQFTTDAQIRQMIEEAQIPKEEKAKYLNRLEDSSTEVEKVQLLKDFCNNIGK